MNEIQRQTYLSAIGIDSYMPRWILPGAPESQLCDFPFPDEEPCSAVVGGDNVEPGAMAPVPSATPIAVADVLGNLDVAPKAKVPDKKAAVETPVKVDQTPKLTPRFALTVWRVSDDLMVIDSRQAQLALPTDRLLANILLALGYKISALPKSEVIRWPFIENKGLENSAEQHGEAEAREMLHAYLDGHLLLSPAKHVLLMGEEAARYILPAETRFEVALKRGVELTELGTTAIVVHSLAAMLQEPGLKAVTWRAVQPLRLPAV